MITYYGTGAHPQCSEEAGHTCQEPTGLLCVELECSAPAGTKWTPHWCPDHDAERIDRISASLDKLFGPATIVESPGKPQ